LAILSISTEPEQVKVLNDVSDDENISEFRSDNKCDADYTKLLTLGTYDFGDSENGAK
jgi:hypothetical protein